MKKISIILVLVALIMTACQSLGVNTQKESANEVIKITPSPNQNTQKVNVAKGTSLPDGVVVVFLRSGGLRGTSEQWSIYADGKILNGTGDKFSIDVAQVTAILAAFKAVGFYDMKTSASIGSLGKCNDCYTYQLTVSNAGEINSITFQDGDNGLPQSFWNIINQINTLIVNATKQ